MKLSFVAPSLPDHGAVVVFVLEDRALSQSAAILDAKLGGALSRAMEASRFKGKKDQSLAVLAPGGSNLARVQLVGLGKPAELDALRLQAAGGQIEAQLASAGQASVYVAVDAFEHATASSPSQTAAELALGAKLRAYRFDKYFTKEKDEDKPTLNALTFGCPDPERAAALYEPKKALAEAVAFTRDLVSEPANVVYPASFADAAQTLEEFGLEVDVLGEKEMKKLGMGALLGVGQGSDRESQLVVVQWWGKGKPEGLDDDKKGDRKKKGRKGGEAAERDPLAPIAFVGKGVTFDTGGISIKPSANMEDMKWDMAGAAAVVGAMRALATRKAKANVVGVVGLVENMPSATAQRPGDVVKSMSGQTIEVINTDAEGRLVLSDAIHYTIERFQPSALVDLATLTGAIIIALGHEMAGLFSNDDALAHGLAAAGAAVNEPLWRMPLGDDYDKMIKSDIADMKNVGDRGAGSITAAQFLKRFVGDTTWAHLDIAGVAWAKKDKDVCPKGASAFGVRLLDRFIADTVEG